MTEAVSRLKSLRRRIANCDWPRLASQLDEQGYALTASLLSPDECVELIQLYADGDAFRSRVVMERHNFGRGEYQYFAAPLPPLVSELRESFYPPLARIANLWMDRMNQPERFPLTLEEFLAVCHRHNQTRPTPLLLRYKTDDYNCLHQDLYGEIAFPLQAACVLNQHGHDYAGGEFLLNEQRPRAQTRGEAITIEQGQFIIFPNRYRPARGSRGDYRLNMRHGVSRLRSGERYCLGVIFHDAK
ncbi:MAG TPA: 2OG-Fe(II) oxygenase [Blastocatellia bacterium]|nr:2OG-Fe(II) oxygenase [Blastocatellia bacterium]